VFVVVVFALYLFHHCVNILPTEQVIACSLTCVLLSMHMFSWR